MTTGLRVRVLGRLEIARDGRAVHLPPARRRLLAILLLDPSRPLDREALVERMWGDDPPPTATTALQVHVSALRRALPGLVLSTDAGYAIDTAFLDDRAVFEGAAGAAAERAGAGRWSEALDAAERGLREWRGDPFPELRDDPFALPEVHRLGELHRSLEELRCRSLVELGRLSEALGLLRKLTAELPLRETLWEQTMRALYRSGRSAEALRAYESARRAIAEEFGTEPGSGLQSMRDRILRGDPELGDQADIGLTTNLPAVTTTFVGREEALQQISDLLESQRVVTIVGGPGFGKTRLAVEVGHHLLHRFDAVWFVALADARDERDLIGAVATAAGVRAHAADLAELGQRLARRRELLILDNCEHLLRACADLVRIATGGSSRLRVLATSRRRLGSKGERTWQIRPLRTPSTAVGVRSPSLASPAVRLFVDRARDADRSFRLTPESAAAVATLCQRADGVPLALELAASWVRALSLSDIGEMLAAEQVPETATPRPRHHRSLTAAMEWSIALLPPADRGLFLSASIFQGTFALDDAAAILAPGEDRRMVAATFARLVDASLLLAQRRADGRILYRTLIPIREFARERLAGCGAWPDVRERFVHHYLAKAQRQEQDLFRAVVDLQAIDDDWDNIREAFDRGLALGMTDEVARAIVALNGYFLNRYLAWEERRLLARVLPRITDARVRADALRCAGSKAQVTNDLEESLRFFRAAIEAYRRLDDRQGLAACLLSLSGLHSNRGEWHDGVRAAREAERLVETLDNPSALGIAAYYQGENLAYGGSVERGLAQLMRAGRLFRASGELGRASYALSTLTHLCVVAGNEVVARRNAGTAVALARRSESTYRLVRSLGAAAGVEARWGDPDEARSLLAKVHELMDPPGNERIFEFLFPAVFLLQRLGERELVMEVLQSIDQWLAARRNGYPVPWRSLAETMSAGAVAVMDGVPVTARTIDEVTEMVVQRIS